MYLLHSYKNNDNLIVCIEGRLDSEEEIERLLDDYFLMNKVTSENQFYTERNITSLTLDLSKTDFISEKCLKLFQKYITSNKIEFKNYPLYIGMRLEEFSLLK